MNRSTLPALSGPLDVLPWSAAVETALCNKNLDADLRFKGHNRTTLEEPSDWSVMINGRMMTPELEPRRTAFSFLSQSATRAALKEEATKYFKAALEQLKNEINFHPPEEENRLALKQEGNKRWDEIANQFNDTKFSTSRLIQEVHAGLTKLLISLRASYAQPNFTPQVLPTADGKWSVIKPASKIENAAFSGGGPRGVGYIPVLKVLREAGVLEKLQHVAGTSVGAVTAAAVACGIEPEKLEAITEEAMAHALETPADHTSSQKMSSVGLLEGRFIPELVNREIVASARRFFEDEQGNEEAINRAKSSGHLTSEEAENLCAFRTQILTETAAPEMTFYTLSLLHKMDPSRFKELTIVGHNATQARREDYNATTTPTMPIAHAVRISMSLLPMFCAPTNEAGDLLIDGGLSSAIPAEAFDPEHPEKTLLLGFSYNRGMDAILHQPGGRSPWWITSLGDLLTPLLGGSTSAAQRNTFEKLYQAGPNTLRVEHGNVGGLSFFAPSKTVQEAQRQAEVRALEWVATRQHQAMHTVYDSLDEALSSLRREELQSIVDSYSPPDPSVRLLSVRQRNEKHVYEAAQTALAK